MFVCSLCNQLKDDFCAHPKCPDKRPVITVVFGKDGKKVVELGGE
jgi:hypothetical protein